MRKDKIVLFLKEHLTLRRSDVGGQIYVTKGEYHREVPVFWELGKLWYDGNDYDMNEIDGVAAFHTAVMRTK
jgi:hypothetical protein